MDRLLEKQKENDGFSLIELVVVVAVLAVLSAIAIPSFVCFPKRARATAALAALRQIKTECALKEAEAKPEIFTSTALDGYTIQTSGSNSCDGSNGVISALPDNTNELPTFNLAAATGSLNYVFKGNTGTNFTECLGMICGNGVSLANLPPNESTLFGPDSGLSCREVNSTPTTFSHGYVYLDGRDSVDLTLQPVTLSVGDQSWEIKGVETTIKRVPGYLSNDRFADTQWLSDFAQKAVDTINESEGGFSAEIDSDNPGSIKIYSSTGEQQNQLEMKVDQSVNGQGINQAAAGTNPWAYPGFGSPDFGYYMTGDQDNENWNADKGSYINDLNQKGKTTTVCDGR